MRTLVCDRPGEVTVFGVAATIAGAGSGPRADPPRRRLRHRSAHFRGFSSVPRDPRSWRRTVGRGRGDRSGNVRSRSARRFYVIPYLACGVCVACRRGKTNCCQQIGVPACTSTAAWPTTCVSQKPTSAPADGMTLDQANSPVPFSRAPLPTLARTTASSLSAPGRSRYRLHAVQQTRGWPSYCARPSPGDWLGLLPRPAWRRPNVRRGRTPSKPLSPLTSGDFFDIVIDATGNVKSMMAGPQRCFAY